MQVVQVSGPCVSCRGWGEAQPIPACCRGGPESFVELQLHSAPAGGGELCLNSSVNSVKQQHELRAIFPKHE